MASRFFLLTLGGTVLATTALVVACGSSAESKFGEGDSGTFQKTDPDGSFGSLTKPDSGGDLYANDPPPQWCGPEGQPAPPQPTGTLECPSDKNKPGCGCTEAGKEAACWTGLRANRNLGICKDGKTVCKRISENVLQWGECEGQVLPASGVNKGADACKCFSVGTWKLKNLSPCRWRKCVGDVCTVSVTSTKLEGNEVKCPADPENPDVGTWSEGTLTGDCAGRFKLCYRIRVGNIDDRKPNDCVVTEVCADEHDYKEANVEQAWPPLKSWKSNDAACAKAWYDRPSDISPGYGEMVVKGKSVRCDPVDDGNGGDLIFKRIKYCPFKCDEPKNKDLAECKGCGNEGAGSF